MSDFDLVARTLARVAFACRAEQVMDPEGQTDRTADPGRETDRTEGLTARVRPVVSAHQADVLSHLEVRDPTMVGELADHMGVTASTMSLTLKRIEELGLVTRDRDPADRRVVNVRLTEAGARVRDAHTALDAGRVERMLSLLDAAERGVVRRGLGLLGDAADAMVRRRREDVEAQVGGEVR